MLLVLISVEKLWTRSTVKKNNSFRQATFGAPKPLPGKLHKRWYYLINQILHVTCYNMALIVSLNSKQITLMVSCCSLPQLPPIPPPLCPPVFLLPLPQPLPLTHSPSVSSPNHSPSLSLLPSTPDLLWNASHCHMGIPVCFTYCCIYSTCHSAWHPAGTFQVFGT